jgi:guanylate kinase
MMSQDVEATILYRREQVPLVVVISGPSGVGKDAVVQRLRERSYPFYFVVTATDRPARPYEVHGRDYYFYSTQEFEQMIADGELLEHAVVYGQHKGIPKKHVRQALASGQDVVMRVDIQGADTVKELVPDAVTIFLTCETEEELIHRLRERRTESDAAVQARLAVARQEIKRIPDFDYVVMNRRDGLDRAVDDVLTIMRAEHCRSCRPRASL